MKIIHKLFTIFLFLFSANVQAGDEDIFINDYYYTVITAELIQFFS